MKFRNHSKNGAISTDARLIQMATKNLKFCLFLQVRCNTSKLDVVMKGPGDTNLACCPKEPGLQEGLLWITKLSTNLLPSQSVLKTITACRCITDPTIIRLLLKDRPAYFHNFWKSKSVFFFYPTSVCFNKLIFVAGFCLFCSNSLLYIFSAFWDGMGSSFFVYLHLTRGS